MYLNLCRGERPIGHRTSGRPPALEAAIPWLYLKGVSTGQMQSALEAIAGPEAKGLSANVVGRLKKRWEVEYALAARVGG